MVGIVLLQALLLNKINLFGYVTPLFYIWMIVRMDSSMSRNSILLWSFFLGLSVDIFSGTPGLNAASATMLGMIQPVIVKLFIPLDRYEFFIPSSATMGGRKFTGYLMLLVLLHHALFFILRSIPLGDWSVLVVKVLLSALLTILIMLTAEYAFAGTASKRS